MQRVWISVRVDGQGVERRQADPTYRAEGQQASTLWHGKPHTPQLLCEASYLYKERDWQENTRALRLLAISTKSPASLKVFRAPQISVARKALILRASVLPKLLFGVGSWAPLTCAEHRQFSGVPWRLYRPLLGLRYQQDQEVSFHTCLALVGLPSPDTTLKMHRLLYLSQLVRHGPDALWALLRADRPHSACLLEACRWLFAWIGPAAALPAPEADWQPGHDLMLHQPGRFKGLVKRAVRLQSCRHVVIAALDGLHKGLQGGPPAAVLPGLDTCVEACLPCRRAFVNRVSWSGHAARCHGFGSQAFLLGRGRLCEGCGKVFASTGRLRRHLVTAFRCRDQWGSFQQIGTLPTEGHPQAPPVWSGVPSQCAPLDVPCETFCGPLLDCLLSATDYDSSALWECVVDHVAPLEVLRHTLTLWRHRRVRSHGLLRPHRTFASSLNRHSAVTVFSAFHRAVNAPLMSFPPGGRFPKLLVCSLVLLGLHCSGPSSVRPGPFWALPHPGQRCSCLQHLARRCMQDSRGGYRGVRHAAFRGAVYGDQSSPGTSSVMAD